MRSPALAATVLAGLLAVAAPPAQALCAVDDEGGCSRLQHTVRLDLSEDCADGRPLCLVDDGNFSAGPNDAGWDVTVRNPTASPVTFELFAFGRYDEDGMPVRDDRAAPRLLATVEVPAGETVVLEDVLVPGNASYLRAQALADGRQAELEGELANFRIMMMQPGGDDTPVDDSSGEPSGNLDDDVPAGAESDGKDAPALPLALLVAAVLAALAVARRVR